MCYKDGFFGVITIIIALLEYSPRLNMHEVWAIEQLSRSSLLEPSSQSFTSHFMAIKMDDVSLFLVPVFYALHDLCLFLLQVSILPSKAVKCPGSNDKFRCPVEPCSLNGRTGSRVFISKHFCEEHRDYRSWRDVFIKKDAPPFVLREEGTSDQDDSTTERSTPIVAPDGGLPSFPQEDAGSLRDIPTHDISTPAKAPTSEKSSDTNAISGVPVCSIASQLVTPQALPPHSTYQTQPMIFEAPTFSQPPPLPPPPPTVFQPSPILVQQTMNGLQPVTQQQMPMVLVPLNQFMSQSSLQPVHFQQYPSQTFMPPSQQAPILSQDSSAPNVETSQQRAPPGAIYPVQQMSGNSSQEFDLNGEKYKVVQLAVPARIADSVIMRRVNETAPLQNFAVVQQQPLTQYVPQPSTIVFSDQLPGSHS